MFIKYTGSGCYRFLDDMEKTLYVGSSKNIHRRLGSHFSNSGSNVDKEAYKNTARVEIIKTDTYGKALDLEQYLINEYKPKYNKRDKSHNINSKVVRNEEEYKKLEKWELYYKLKKLDKEKIKLSEKQDKLLMGVTYAVFIIAIIMYIF